MLFFTLPPKQIKWPWILTNQMSLSRALSYLREHRDAIEYVLLDSGVEKLFRKPNPPKDYPLGYERMWYNNAQKLVKMFGKEKVWVVIPDYPDDYAEVWGKPHALWKDGKDNIERTVENVVRYWDKYRKEFELVVPIQGHYEEPQSIRKAVKLLHEHGILSEARIFGIANLCKTRKVTIIVETCKLARRLLGNKWLHVFGPSLAAVKKLMNVIDSFDTMAWTFPREPHRWSAKTMQERIEYFMKYVIELVRTAREITNSFDSEALCSDNSVCVGTASKLGVDIGEVVKWRGDVRKFENFVISLSTLLKNTRRNKSLLDFT